MSTKPVENVKDLFNLFESAENQVHYNPTATDRADFMQRLETLKKAAMKLSELQNDVRKMTMETFENNMSLAYDIGVDESMSYGNSENHALEIESLTSGASESMWLPSSWESC